jgi:hypothetical protein
VKHYARSALAGDEADTPNVVDLLSDADLASALLVRILGREARQPDLITEREIVAELARKVLEHGTAARAADALDVEPSEISKSLAQGRPVSKNLAEALGYRKVTRYERIG